MSPTNQDAPQIGSNTAFWHLFVGALGTAVIVILVIWIVLEIRWRMASRRGGK